MEKPNRMNSAWLELEQIVSRFEEALHDQKSPRIRDYLLARDADPVTLLIELIAAEAEHRWRHGQVATLSEYVSKFADLLSEANDRERLAVALVDVQQTIPLGNSKTVPIPENSPKEQRSSEAKHLGRYQMIEPISGPSKSSAEHPSDHP